MDRERPSRATWVAATCLVAGSALGIAAWSVAGGGSDELSAPAASLAAAPSTLAPVAGSVPATGARPVPVPESTAAVAAPTTSEAPTTTTTPLSPLAAGLGEPVSVLPAAPVAATEPVRLSVGAIGVDVPVRGVGVAADGQLEIPDETEVGWYRLGAAPGEPGATVIAGHVNWHGVDGPFLRLRELEPGATIDVALADGTTRRYTVTERQQYAKTELPAERLWTREGPEVVVLITCGGSFNPEIRRYRDNIVTFAVPTG
jgi:hypothetical protein